MILHFFIIFKSFFCNLQDFFLIFLQLARFYDLLSVYGFEAFGGFIAKFILVTALIIHRKRTNTASGITQVVTIIKFVTAVLVGTKIHIIIPTRRNFALIFLARFPRQSLEVRCSALSAPAQNGCSCHYDGFVFDGVKRFDCFGVVCRIFCPRRNRKERYTPDGYNYCNTYYFLHLLLYRFYRILSHYSSYASS